MQVLQFIFEDTSQEITLPLKFAGNSVVYTGTHDNDTLWGWFTKHYQEKTGVVEYLKEKLNLDYSWNCEQICWQFIKIALESNAILAIIPLQDLLCLDSSARMNYPGTLGGNWEWRFKKGVLTKELQLKLLNMVEASKR
ncbi:MAG: 4-alpha-glucanotransferase, partial [Clostridia bacterium]|nr:4-alpha-glucanotransferase [Clostridia bacterium]